MSTASCSRSSSIGSELYSILYWSCTFWSLRSCTCCSRSLIWTDKRSRSFSIYIANIRISLCTTLFITHSLYNEAYPINERALLELVLAGLDHELVQSLEQHGDRRLVLRGLCMVQWRGLVASP